MPTINFSYRMDGNKAVLVLDGQDVDDAATVTLRAPTIAALLAAFQAGGMAQGPSAKAATPQHVIVDAMPLRKSTRRVERDQLGRLTSIGVEEDVSA